jgi:hypothetical protein
MINRAMINRAKMRGSIGLVTLTPDNFLSLTTDDGGQSLTDKALTVEYYNHLIAEGQIKDMPWLKVRTLDGMVIDSDGRHRAVASLNGLCSTLRCCLFLTDRHGVVAHHNIDHYDLPPLYRGGFTLALNSKSFTSF